MDYPGFYVGAPNYVEGFEFDMFAEGMFPKLGEGYVNDSLTLPIVEVKVGSSSAQTGLN